MNAGARHPQRPVCARARRPGEARPRHRGQATVEFSLVFGLFLVSLLAIIDAWIWTIETDAVDASVEQGIGVAMSALGSAVSPTPALTDVYSSVLPLLRAPLLGTSLEDWYAPDLDGLRTQVGPTRCPSADEVADYFQSRGSGLQGVGHLVVCAVEDGAGHVIVAVTGFAVSFVPPGLGPFNWRGWGLPISESASVNVGTYSP